MSDHWNTYRYSIDMSRSECESLGLDADKVSRQIRDEKSKEEWLEKICVDSFKDVKEYAPSASDVRDIVEWGGCGGALKNGFSRVLMSYFGAFMEYAFYASKNPTIFPESKFLCEMLYSAKCFVNVHDLKFVYPVFAIAIPQGLVLDGVAIDPFLVSIRQIEDSFPSNYKRLMVDMGWSPDPRSALTIVKRLSAGRLRTYCIGKGQIDKHLHLTEYREMEVYFKLAAGLLTYSKAFPLCVVDGFPNTSDRAIRHLKAKGIKPIRFDLDDELKGAKRSHWRRWHFRTLRADRYARNDDGTERIVFVRDTIVGRMTPKTIVSKNDWGKSCN